MHKSYNITTSKLVLSTATDYYPFGMPMPNRQIIGGEQYRYSFQGQEKDPETGKEAFQLRLWDGRIGRWLTPDPKGILPSPYIGMANNPVSNIDPDGGCVVGEDCPPEFDWMGKGTFVLDEVVIGGGGGGVNWTSDAISNGGIYDFSTMSQAGWETTYAISSMQMESINAIMNPTLERSQIEGYDYNQAVETLNTRAYPKYIKGKCGFCAKAVRISLEGGGLSTIGRPGSAKDYDTFLPRLGFNEVEKHNYTPITGDMIVIEAFGTHKHGHIQMYNGEQWVSDFLQRDFWPGSSYRKANPNYKIFR